MTCKKPNRDDVLKETQTFHCGSLLTSLHLQKGFSESELGPLQEVKIIKLLRPECCQCVVICKHGDLVLAQY